MKKLINTILIICLLALCGCRPNKEMYLSITTTSYNENGELIFNVYKYALSKKQLENKFEKKYTSQYPLGIFSQSKNTVYYTAEYEKNHGDQLFAYNLDTKETKMLTDDFYAINQIIPISNKIYIIGVKIGERLLKPSIYDFETNKLITLNNNDDLNFENMVYDVFHHNIYFSANYQKEVDEALDKANQGKGSKYISPDTHIYFLEKNKLKHLYSTNCKLIYRMLPQKNGDLCFTESESIPAWDPEYFTYSFDKSTNKKHPTINIDEIMNVTQFTYFISSNQIVFLGTKVDSEDEQHIHRGIYLYNIDSCNIELLFELEEQYINNFILLDQ